jgi:hypothetical protein
MSEFFTILKYLRVVLLIIFELVKKLPQPGKNGFTASIKPDCANIWLSILAWRTIGFLEVIESAK